MEDFGYIKNKEKDSHILKKAFLFGAAVFSVVCFVYITVSAYYFVYHDPKNNEIKLIKSPDHEIKVISDDEKKDSTQRRAIYEDVFGDDNANSVQSANFPKEPILPSEEEKQNAVLGKENLVPAKTNQVTQKENETIKTAEKKVENITKEQQNAANVTSQKQVIKEEKLNKKLKVQVGAFSSNEAANNYFNRLQSNYSSLISGKKNYIKEVKIANKGTFHRLQIGDFSDQISAEKFCQQFIAATKESKSDCILVE